MPSSLAATPGLLPYRRTTRGRAHAQDVELGEQRVALATTLGRPAQRLERVEGEHGLERQLAGMRRRERLGERISCRAGVPELGVRDAGDLVQERLQQPVRGNLRRVGLGPQRAEAREGVLEELRRLLRAAGVTSV
jgi:hypothetical protein